MSTFVEPPPDPIVISTPYGKVPAHHYNRDLTPADISQMLVDIEAQASPGALVTEFIVHWINRLRERASVAPALEHARVHHAGLR